MKRPLVEVTPSVFGDATRRKFYIDVPALVRRRMLPDAPMTRAVLARRGLRQLRGVVPGSIVIARMQGVPRG
jgi:hypothetical protein